MRRAGFVCLTILIVMAAMLPGRASSHREAPLIAQDPLADNTDVYAFVDPNDQSMVTMITNFIPFEKPDGGPNFYQFDPNVVYALHVDNNGDAIEDITFEWRFTTEVRNTATFLYNTGPVQSLTDTNLNVRQFYQLTRIDGPRRTGSRRVLADHLPVMPPNIGPRSFPHYNELAGGVQQIPPSGMRVFVGPRDEGFYVDLAVFDLLGVQSGATESSTDGFNVGSIALQVPIRDLARNGQPVSGPGDPNAVIGVWSTASRPAVATRTAGAIAYSGDLVQVSRLGQPLVNEVVIDLARKDAFNSLEPKQDAAALDRVTDPELPKLLDLVFGVKSPPAPRNDLVTIFLTGIPGLNQPPNVTPSEMLRLNMGVPPVAVGSAGWDRLGVLGGDVGGFPNGRRVGDDVVDIALMAMAGATPLTPAYNRSPNNTLSDGVNQNDVPYLSTFPYLGAPHAGNK